MSNSILVSYRIIVGSTNKTGNADYDAITLPRLSDQSFQASAVDPRELMDSWKRSSLLK